MKCEIRILSGARAGHQDIFDKSYLGLGRHPLSDVRFDAEKDLDVSSRHAAIVRSGERYVLRDLGSRNGTLVNGEKIDADRQLADGDVIRLGTHGPEASFHLAQPQAETVMPAIHAPPRESPAPGAAPPPPAAGPRVSPPSGGAPPGPSTTSVLRAQVRFQASRFRALTVALLIIMLGAAGVLWWQGRTASRRQVALGNVLDSLRIEIAELRRLRAAADSQAARLQAELARERDPSRRQLLRQQYAQTVRRRDNIAEAQTVNYRAISAANRRAVAIIYVQFADTTEMWSGTAFCVTTDGLLITNRHVVVNQRGQQPSRIAIQFSGSAEVHPAGLERVARDADLAIVRLESAGPFPVVQGLVPDPASVQEGDPIGLVGFPHGLDLPMGATPTASLFTGTVSRIIPDSLLQLDAYSGTGASGSPIFDRQGRVIGVEFGGIRESAGRVILGLPIRRAMALLPS